jgi:small nuclear ribonucleoprotein (snRNP)-like protein
MSLLPLSLLRAAQRQPMLVELKNGDTYNGNLVGSDNFMNLALKDVTITSKDGLKFWSQPEVFVRGLAIKYIRACPSVCRPAPFHARTRHSRSRTTPHHNPLPISLALSATCQQAFPTRWRTW